MEDRIRHLAYELGFDACQFTSAAAPDHARQLQSWLQAGWHGEMAYLARNAAKRMDPQLVLPGARSIITLAASYGQRQKVEGKTQTAGIGAPQVNAGQGGNWGPAQSAMGQSPSSATGVVARYACFADYHDVLAEPLKQLTARVDALGGPGTRSLWYVDTGPVLERDPAQRAGLGFIGKHTNLISRSLGNWFLLAEILTTLELRPDTPEKNRCGTCTRCLAACPTGALPAPFQLDARKCISYLTIELKGAIPVELRPLVGNRIFGCDDCLAVCPWNRFAQAGRLLQAHARPELAEPDLIALLQLDEAGFRRQFAGTPLMRAKRRGLRRNVCVALGNVAGPAALPALRQAAADPDPLVAEHAYWAITQILGSDLRI